MGHTSPVGAVIGLCSNLLFRVVFAPFCRGRRPRRPVLKNIFNISGGASPSPTANLCLEVFLGNNAHCGGLHLIRRVPRHLPLKGKAFKRLCRCVICKQSFFEKRLLAYSFRVRNNSKTASPGGEAPPKAVMRCSPPPWALSPPPLN